MRLQGTDLRDTQGQDAWRFYDQLLDCVRTDAHIGRLTPGVIWTLCQIGEGMGLAMSPELPRRSFLSAKSLQGRPAKDVADWVRSWQPHEASVGMATMNAVLNQSNPLLAHATPLYSLGPNRHSVFEYFREQIAGKNVVVIGRHPSMEVLRSEARLTVLDEKPGNGELSLAAAEYVLPDADWVFLAAVSIANKTFPRLAELSRHAKLVLIGPSTPWVPMLRDYGVDYLAGVSLRDPRVFQQVVAEGGGTRIFNDGVQYALVDLHQSEDEQIKSAIAALFERRAMLKAEMEAWYAQGKSRFPGNEEILRIDARLSVLDQRYKQLWDAQWAERKQATA